MSKSSCHSPHQGDKEKKRRIIQLAKGFIKDDSEKYKPIRDIS